MATTRTFIGNAAPYAQIQTYQPGQQPPGTTISATINNKVVSYTSATGTNDDLVAGLVGAWSLTIPEFGEVSAQKTVISGAIAPNATKLTLQSKTVGQPFTVVITLTTSPTCTVVRTTPGKPAVNEKQKLSLGPNIIEAAFTVTFGVNTTPAIPTPPSSIGVGAGGAGSVDTGTHWYGITFLTALGETELGVCNAYPLSSPGGVTVTVPTAPVGYNVTGRRVYRTKAGAGPSGPFYLVTTINDNTTGVYTDNTADASLSNIQAPETNYALQGALASLANIGAGNVRVSGAATIATLSASVHPTTGIAQIGASTNNLYAWNTTDPEINLIYCHGPSPVVYEIEFCGTLGGASQALVSAAFSNAAVLVVPTITENVRGCPIRSEVQKIGWVQSYGLAVPTGSYKITIAELGVTTAPLSFDSTAAQVLAAIQAAAPAAYASSFAVTSLQATNAGYLFSLTYEGLLANMNVAQASVDVSAMAAATGDVVSAYQETTTPGSAISVDEVIAVSTASTNYNISVYDYDTGLGLVSTGGLSTANTIAQIQAAFGTDVCTVTGTSSSYVVNFQGELGGRRLRFFFWAASQSTSATATVTEEKTGSAAVNEVQTVTINGATGGTLTLAYEGQSTSDIAYNAAAATVQTDVQALSTVGANNLTVSGAAGGPYTVTGAGAFAGSPLALIAADVSKLTGTATSTPALTTVQSATGPNNWDNAANWSPSGVPVTGDTVFIQNNSTPILYGLDQHTVVLADFSIDMSFAAGKIGLPAWNGKYYEYRPQYLQIGVSGTITIGNGKGSGPTLLKLDTGTNATTIIVNNSGNSSDPSLPPIIWKGSRSAGSTAINLNKGKMAIAPYIGETATVDTIRQNYVGNKSSDTYVLAGGGCTITTWNKNGGDADAYCSVTTLTHEEGSFSLFDFQSVASTIGTLSLIGGAFYHNATGTITTASIGTGAVYDRTEDSRPVHLGTTKIYGKSSFLDPHGSVVFDTAYQLIGCGYPDLTKFDVGSSITATRTKVTF